MDDNGTDLGNVLNDQPAQESQPAPQDAQVSEPSDLGEQQAEPPAAKQPEPDLVPRAALMDERRKRQELEQWVKQSQQQKQPEQPKPEQFESNEAYIAALVESRAAQVVDRRLHELSEQQKAEVQRQQMEADSASLMTAGKTKYTDFGTVVSNPDLPITDTMVAAMLAVDAGPDVAYHLGKNPAEALRIAQMPATSQAREIGQLAKKLSAPPPVQAQPPRTLTQTRSADGRFTQANAWSGPSPLNDILGNRS